jgi:hypothetical protein
MNVLNLVRRAIAVVAIGIFVGGCGESEVQGIDVGVQGSRLADHSGRSWIKPGSSAGDLLYASGYSQSTGYATFILTYPQGQLVGSIAATGVGMCTDTSGNVFMTSQNAVTEYAHGGTTPIATVRIPGAETENCAVDPTTGDLAVTFDCPPCDYENLAIFPPGSKTSTRYSAPDAYECTYDNQGNLFLGGYSGSQLAELPSGSNTFTTITLNEDIASAGRLQWDGTYVTLQDLASPGGIYRISIAGSSGTIVGETKFGRYMRRVGYSWISGSTVAVPFSVHGSQTNQLGIWKYPRGGRAMKVLKKFGTGDSGFGVVTVSVAPTH